MTDQEQEQKLKEYEDYLSTLSRELLLNEFNDKLGCDPEEYYTNANNALDMDVWITTLVDCQAFALYQEKMNTE